MLRQRQPREKDDKHLEFIGRRFGRVQVMSFVCSAPNTTIWRVRCDCGTEKNVRRSNLLSLQSCGCLVRERMAARATHAMTRVGQQHPLYETYSGMVKRCHGSGESKRYKQRGIYVCDRWRFGNGPLTGFECFLADMGDRPSGGYSIDRVNNNGPYSADNCRWATQTEQQRNKSSNRVIKRELYFKNCRTGEVSGHVDVSCQSEREIDRIMRGMSINKGGDWIIMDTALNPTVTRSRGERS